MGQSRAHHRSWGPAILAALALVAGACGNRSLGDLEGAAGVPQAYAAGVPAGAVAPASGDVATGSESAAGGATGADATTVAVPGAAPSVAGAATPAAAAARGTAAAPSSSGSPSAAPSAARPSAGAASQVAGETAPSAPGGGQAGAPVPDRPAQPGGGGGKVLSIGGVYHRTGPIPLCNTAFEGVSSYLSDLNERGGINGYKFKLIAYDDGADATRNAALMKQLIERDNVLTILQCSDLVAPAGKEVVDKHSVPVIAAFGASDVLFEDPNWFPTSGFQQALYPFHALQYSKNKFNATKAGLVYINVPQGQGGARYTRKYAPRLGMEIVYESAFSPAEPDFTAYVVKLKQAGAEVVIFPGAADGVIRFLKAAEQQGFEGKLVAPLTAYDPIIGPAVGKYVDGHLFTVINHAPLELSEPAAVARYQNTVKKYYPNVTMNTYGIDGWSLGEMLEEGMKRLGDAEPTRPSLHAALSTLKDWQGSFTPPLTMGTGPHTFPTGCASVLAAKPNGSFVPESARFVCTDSY
jgi:branched-chain amino acid transport system substrate-binding protein